MSKKKKKNKEKKAKIRSAVARDLLTSGKYGQRIERDRTKFKRKPKHREEDDA